MTMLAGSVGMIASISALVVARSIAVNAGLNGGITTIPIHGPVRDAVYTRIRQQQ